MSSTQCKIIYVETDLCCEYAADLLWIFLVGFNGEVQLNVIVADSAAEKTADLQHKNRLFF